MKTLDTRALYNRKCELEALRDAVTEAQEELDNLTSEGDPQEVENYWGRHEELNETLDAAELDFGDDEKEELAELETLESEISDFMHGATLILERDFEAYAQELAEDITPGFREANWPFTCIDWEQAADELRQDYTEVEYQGDTYLVRA